MATDNPAPPEEQPQDMKDDAAEPTGESASAGGPAADDDTSSGDDDDDDGSEVDVRGVNLGEIPDPESGGAADVGGNLEMLLDIPMPISVEVGRAKVLLEEVLQIGPGFVLRLEKKVGDPVDLMINGRRVAEGEVVAVDEQLGIRITKVLGEPPIGQ